MVEKSRMTRKDVIMDSKALSLSYHAMEQVMTSLQSLVTQYPSYAKMYDHPDLERIKITNDHLHHLLHQACDPSGWWLVSLATVRGINLKGQCVTGTPAL